MQKLRELTEEIIFMRYFCRDVGDFSDSVDSIVHNEEMHLHNKILIIKLLNDWIQSRKRFYDQITLNYQTEKDYVQQKQSEEDYVSSYCNEEK